MALIVPTDWKIYNDYLKAEGEGKYDLTSDTLKLAAFTSDSIAINVAVEGATYTAFAADGHEVANANGYVTGGLDVPTKAWTGSSASTTTALTGGRMVFSATGDGYALRALVLYDDTATGKPAIAYFLPDSTPADVAVTVDNPLKVNVATVFNKHKAA